MDALLDALRPLSDPPSPPGWNHQALSGLIEDTSRRPAAVLLGIRNDAQARLVFTVRRDHLLLHAGQVAFPGGGSEPADGGSALLTALRESEEEIGLAPALVTPLGYLDCLETTSGFCVTPVVAHIAPHAQLVPSPDEVAEVFEVPLAYFLDPCNRHCYTMEFRGRPHPMVEFVHSGHRIWGATAAIVDNLLHRMKNP
jgi:8-oxo-dGTP pyrophosphatase MutT (NUDIX family)